jgi:hypothetical protein
MDKLSECSFEEKLKIDIMESKTTTVALKGMCFFIKKGL